MDGPTALRATQDQTAMSSGIVWIVLQQFSRRNTLLQLFYEYVLILTLSMDREFVVVSLGLLTDVFQDIHTLSIVYRPACLVQSHGWGMHLCTRAVLCYNPLIRIEHV